MLVIRREAGVLKRLRATPLPAPAYIAALLTAFMAAFAVEVAGLILLGRVLFSIPLPHQLGSLVLALLLGAICFCALGVAVAALIRSAEGASAVVNAIYAEAFGAHKPARTLIEVAALPRHALIEIEAWAYLPAGNR